ncbi:hypothetical protein BJ138DRAFT_1105688 [Hygrophoropsis aurantiaca]|uniref:Uncharacterized protein n=1 Tax=Hygrophoropsis aurantiaca TaxID=72124 RepID=A0ACB7ZXC6_9AGAM|nr:hypothetical protein BJ138DRAFT_1105688 [Hygrophoropsis aurantiaca]
MHLLIFYIFIHPELIDFYHWHSQLPAGSQPSNQTPATDRLPNDFFDSSPDLPAYARNQISIIPIAAVPLRPSVPKPKTGSKIPPASTPSPSNLFGRVGSRFRRVKHAPEAIEVQPPPPKLPKYSPVGKVALGQADKSAQDIMIMGHGRFDLSVAESGTGSEKDSM